MCTREASGVSKNDTEHEHCTNYCLREVIFVLACVPLTEDIVNLLYCPFCHHTSHMCMLLPLNIW